MAVSPPILPADAPLLAIETSCDDTACAILNARGHILGESVLSQEEHKKLGGVVPEIAARAHLEALPPLMHLTLDRAGLTLDEIAVFAATTGPGLIGGLIVGSSYAKGLALAKSRPFIGVNHIEGHILSPRLPNNDSGKPALAFPYLALLVSGGHCQCVLVENIGQYRQLGGTIDDSAGEAFDKVAKMLGLGWPGGPMVEKIAQEGDSSAFAFPRPLRNRPGCDFSFSGLKTAIARTIEPYGTGSLPRQLVADIAASFQQAVADVLDDRVRNALAMISKDNLAQSTALVVVGGVAANKNLRQRLKIIADDHKIAFAAPPLRLCTDNAVMIGWAALEHLCVRGKFPHPDHACPDDIAPDDIALPPRPRWPLEERRSPCRVIPSPLDI